MTPSAAPKQSNGEQATPGATDRMMAKLLPALERLLDRGESFTEISVEALMGEAGMARRTFYWYFNDKAGFLHAAATDVVGRMVATVDAWWDSPPGRSRRELESSIASIATTYEPNRGLMRAVAEAATYDDTIAALHRSQLEHIAAGIKRHITAGQASGVIEARMHAPSVAIWLTMMLSFGLAELPPNDTPAKRARRLTAVSEILWRTLYNPSTP
jgi:AcrR family transcriptional regulator